MHLLKRFVRCTAGQDLIEYGLLIGIVSVTVMLAINSIRTNLNVRYQSMDSSLTMDTGTGSTPGGTTPGGSTPGGSTGGGNSGGGNSGGGNSGGGRGRGGS